MSKYFLDTEFIEGPQHQYLFGIRTPITGMNTIDLISIGIVAEDGREYYSVSSDFNLREAWNRYQLNHGHGDQRNRPPVKEYWIRENVLKPIFKDLFKIHDEKIKRIIGYNDLSPRFNFKNLKELIKSYGKPNAQIASEIQSFCGNDGELRDNRSNVNGKYWHQDFPEFYAYYADYDWVVFSWLFGKMIDLPKGFPKYCRDLKQILDDKVNGLKGERTLHYLKEIKGFDPDGDIISKMVPAAKIIDFDKIPFEYKLNIVKNEFHSYPKQKNEHNALADAKWNLELYKFLKEL